MKSQKTSASDEIRTDKTESPLSTGLSATISPEILKNGFVRFSLLPTPHADILLSNGILHFDKPGLTAGDVFKEKAWARLPSNERIIRDTRFSPACFSIT